MAGLSVFMLGLVLVFGDWAAPRAVRFNRADTLAENYVVYRNAVISYAESHPGASGQVALPDLSLPPGWRPLATLDNRIHNGEVTVWGDLPSASELPAERHSGWSLAVGVAELKGGIEVGFSESEGTWFPIPFPVPVGALVSDVDVY